MQHARIALFFGSSLLAGIGVLVACSTDNGTVPLPGGGSSTTSSGSSGKGTSGNPGDDDDATVGDDDDVGTDSGADCGNAPVLRKTSAGFFCAHYKDGGSADAGGNSNCSNDQTCCNPGKDGTTFPLSYCASTLAADKANGAQAACAAQAADFDSKWVATGSTTWECASPSNCGGTKKCCAHSVPGADAGNKVNIGPSLDKTIPAACKAQYLFKAGGTKCAATCGANEFELCSSTDPCPSGKTCLAAETDGFRDIGYCK